MRSASEEQIVNGSIERSLSNWLQQKQYTSLFILVDENTRKYCLPKLSRIHGSLPPNIIEIKSGEKQKNLDTCHHIWAELLDHRADRHALLVNLGGGVIGDMGGFVAATYKRGIDFIQVPTSLLAMVDASVGGKTGINFYGAKNSIGVFKEPERIFMDISFLDTLSERHIRNGFAEIIKHSLIEGAEHWQMIRNILQQEKPQLDAVIQKSINVKSAVVLEDPFEKGRRKVLNFGHTIGHGIESLSLIGQNKEILHGEAIAAGMVCALFLSEKKLGFPKSQMDQIIEILSGKYSRIDLADIELRQIIGYIRNDKKNLHGDFKFVLLREIGKPEIDISCSEEDILEALKFYIDRYAV